MGAKFLCCLPLKLGVYTVVIFQLLFNGFLAVILWISLSLSIKLRLRSGPIASVVIYALTFTFGFFLALVGLIGLIRRKTNIIGVLLRLMIYLTIFWTWESMITMITLMTSNITSDILDCTGDDRSQESVANCADAVRALHDGKFITLLVFLFVVLPISSQLYGLYIVHAYYKKIRQAKLMKDLVASAAKRRQSWTIDGPGIEPPDWTSMSARSSQIDFLQKENPGDDLEAVPLTANISSASEDIGLGSGKDTKGKWVI